MVDQDSYMTAEEAEHWTNTKLVSVVILSLDSLYQNSMKPQLQANLPRIRFPI